MSPPVNLTLTPNANNQLSDAVIQQAIANYFGSLAYYNFGGSTIGCCNGNTRDLMALVFLPPGVQVQNGASSTCTASTCGYFSLPSGGGSPVPYSVIPQWSGGCSQCWSTYPGASSAQKTFVEAVELTIKMMTFATTVSNPPYGNPGTDVISACGLQLGTAIIAGQAVSLPRVWFLGQCVPA